MDRDICNKRRATQLLSRRMGPRFRGDDIECAEVAGAYASPSVSNIAALIASAAVFPAQTTNWNAG